MALCCRRACWALTRKNMILKSRTPISTLLEILLPLAFVLAMYGIKTLFSDSVTPAAAHVDDGTTLLPLQSLPPLLARRRQRVAVLGLGAADFLADASALYPPLNGSTFGGTGFASPLLRSLYIPGFADITLGTMRDEASLEAYIADPTYGDAGHPPVFAAVVFNGGAPAWDYSLRFNLSDVPSTSGIAVNTFSTAYRPSALNQYISVSPSTSGGGGGFAPTPGFLSLQLAVDRFILGRNVSTGALDYDLAVEGVALAVQATGGFPVLAAFLAEVATLDPLTPEGRAMQAALVEWVRSESRVPQQVDVIPFPTPSFKSNLFYAVILNALTLFVVLGFLFPISQLVRALVLEKELRLREVMKQMGATDGDIWGSWLVTYAFLYALLCLLITGVCTRIFPASSPAVLFVLWYSYALSSTSWALLVSVFFTKSRTASVLGGLTWIAGYLAYFSLSPTTPAQVRSAAALLAPTALGSALEVIGALETNGLGATPVTALSSVVNNWTVSSSIGMLLFDTVFYLALAWYFDKVLPSWAREYGVPRPPWFILTPSYWAEACGCSTGRRVANAADGSAHVTTAGGGVVDWLRGRVGGAPADGAVVVNPAVARRGGGGGVDPDAPLLLQPYDASLKSKEAAGRCVAVRGLRKTFSTPRGVQVAVDDVSLSFFEGQVSCLLGHNGAGKTTTLQMLAGLIQPSAGSATAFGIDCFEDQVGLRKLLGVCPQHDVLWPQLTVREHLRLFSALKGVSAADVQTECDKALSTVGLADKADARVATLSGGMKRKLSIVLAFLGGSKIVFLDEPTSGVDPFSRRAMWNIIQSYREGRVIILTTHFMDEADVLGDRIAIMDKGRLHCAGTPMFLKEAFGVGYTCTIVKAVAGAATDAQLMSVIHRHAPSASVASSAGSELLIRLPLTAASALPALLREVEDAASTLGVVDIGMGVTSLEDVFLAVAEGGGKALGGGKHGHTSVDGAGTSRSERVAAMTTATGTVSPNPLVQGGKGGMGSNGAGLPDESTPMKKPAAVTWARGETSGEGLFWLHTRAILMKRLSIGRRDYRAVCCLLLLPLIVMIVGFAALQSSITVVAPSYAMSTSQFNVPSALPGRGRPGTGTSGGPPPAYPNYVPSFTFKAVDDGTAAVDSPSLRDVLRAIPTGSASFDGGRLFLDPAAVSALPDPDGFINASAPQPVQAYQRMSSFLLSDVKSYAASKYGAFVPTANGSVVPTQALNASFPQDSVLTVGVFVNTPARHGGPIFLNLLTNALLRVGAGVTGGDALGPSITTRSHPLPFTFFQRNTLLSIVSALSLQPLMIALAIVPAACAHFVVREREVAAKHQQTISGVALPAYWLANWVFDAFASVLAVLLALIVLAGYNLTSLISTDKDKAAATALLLLGYSGASTSFTYLLAHLFRSPSAAQAGVVMFNILTFAGLTATSILSSIPSTCTPFPSVNRALDLLPFFAAGDGLTSVSSITTVLTSKAQCDAANGRPFSIPPVPTTAFQLDVAGWPLIYLALETVLYLLAAWGVDYLRSDMAALQWLMLTAAPVWAALGRVGLGGSWGGAPPPATPAAAGAGAGGPDPDVAAEHVRVDEQWGARMGSAPPLTFAHAGGYGSTASTATTPDGGAAARDNILLHHVRKVYPGGKVAVADLCFGVPAGQVFGFLGINGAGKTSTLAMLTGDAMPTSGTALLGGKDIIAQQMAVRRLLGYCPQFDALLDLLSVREHLELYARIKGVPAPLLPPIVTQSLQDCDLGEYEFALAGTLSGGNKRKLSVAIALIGSPPIVFLDEPSTGVDPVARRKLWAIISRVATEQAACSIILTTHSMEEAEALCTRIGIMVGGRMTCLGTAQRLRTVHGSGLACELRLGEPSPASVAAVVDRLVGTGVVAAGGELTAAALPAACAALGMPTRGAEIRADGRGWALAAALSLAVPGGGGGGGAGSHAPPAVPLSLPAAEFAAWWVEEDTVDALLYELCGPAGVFPGSLLRQRQGRSLKVDVPKAAVGARKLGDLYEGVEHLRARFGLESATLSQTTLEQVFNRMAAGSSGGGGASSAGEQGAPWARSS